MDSRKIGKLIESKRKEKSMTQKELGLKINVSDKTISKWEKGLSVRFSAFPKMLDVLFIEC